MKKFYNNTLIGGAFSKALRVIALLCVLFGMSGSAWAWDNELIIWGSNNNKYYYDISSGSCTVNLSSTGDYYFFIKDNKDNGKEKKLSGYSQMSNGNSTDWKFDGTNSDCGLKVNNGETGNFTFKLRWDNSTPVVSVVYPVAASTTYHAKYPWDGRDWYWKEFDKNNQIEGIYREGCMNVDTYENGNATCYVVEKSGTLNNGDQCIFTWNPTSKKVTATAKGGGGGGGGGGTGTDFDFVLDTKTNDLGGWINNGEVYAIFREVKGGNTGMTKQVMLEICDSDNRLAYYNGGMDFKRTDGTAWTPVEVYVYSDDKNDAIATWDGTKNCMVIKSWGKMSNSSGGCTMTTFTGDCDGTSGGGGGGGGDDSPYISFDCLYLNTGGTTWWNAKDATKGAPKFYLYLFNNTTNAKKSVLATVCPDASDIFYAEVPDGEWEGYLWIRKDPTNNTDPAVNWNSAGVWDQTDNCSIHKDLTTITGWENANFTNGTYSGTCGCAGGSGDIDDDTEDYVDGTSVLLSYEPTQRPDKSWTLKAYLEASCAIEITEYGFYLCETDREGGCKPTASSYTYKVNANTTHAINPGDSFTGYAEDLNNAWYGYRAYVVSNGETIVSPNTKYFNNKCQYELTGDTVYVTIDNTLTINNECELKFKSIKDAWTTLKTLPEVCKAEKVTYGWKQDKTTLIKPVVMQLVPTGFNYVGFEKVGSTGGDKRDTQATFLRNINMAGGSPLIIRSIDKSGTRASLQHVAIRRSKNIVLDYLNLVGASRDVATADNAIDIDNGVGDGNLEDLSTDWNCASLSDTDKNTKANIVIKNCEITSYGFTCIHVSAYNGITFENNEIRAMYDFEAADDNQANNTANWGASAKFINSRNIAFIRNNFTGQHATSILLQGSQKVLIYDNVFWHDNGVRSSANTVAIIRLISYGNCASSNPLQDIGIYYNTMFLKDNSVGEGKYHHFDFFRLGGSQQTGNTGNYKPATIEFDYNNCYSYDEDVYGKNYKGSYKYQSTTTKDYLQTMDEDDWCGSFKYNNFWSVYDEKQNPKPTRSAFALGSGCNSDEGKNNFTNVQDLVCKTSPEEPGSLVIKENDLNIGAFIKTDVSGLLTDEMQMIDRLGNPRPYDPDALEGKGTYTLGAYQQTTGEALNKIIWNGNASTDWDNRNNWYKPNGQLVTCVDVLDENLEVIIPAPRSTKYPIPAYGVKQYPTLPAGISDDTKFNDGTRSKYAGWDEEVSAGKGKDKITPTQVAKIITMEYGAAVKGVEELAQDGKTERYNEVNGTLVTPRDQWILVGTVIQPWKNKDNHAEGVRNHLSNDYYMNHYPHVYMHQAVFSSGKASWKNPFADLTIPVPANEVYAIKVANEYGYYKLKSQTYYTSLEKDLNMVDDGIRPKTIPFSGRFLNENSLPDYGYLATGTNHLICNTYPANIDIATLKSEFPGTVQVYNSEDNSFETATSGVILSQNGFVYNPDDSRNLKLTQIVFNNDSTSLRSEMIELPELRLAVTNTADPMASNVLITVDDLKEDAISYASDAPKVFNETEKKVPELYVMRYEGQWSGIAIPSMEEPIPLGVRTLRNNVSIKFSIREIRGIGTVILEDRMVGKSYNLTLGEECIIEALPKGDTEGRFFLNLRSAEVENPDDEEVEDDDLTTEIEDEIVSESGISIIGNSEGIIVSSSADIELVTIIVNDMSGKSAAYKVSGQYAEIKLPVAQGVYTVNVIGDTASKTGKVILK